MYKINVNSDKEFKVLVFRNGDIGNTVVSEPFFRILKKMYPNVIIHAVFDNIGFELMKYNPFLDGIYSFNKKKDSFKKKLELIKTWRKEKFLFSFHLKSGITNEQMAFFSGIKYRIGFPLKGSFQFINYKVIKKKEILHHYENGRYLLSIFGKEVPSELPKLYTSELVTDSIKNLFSQYEIESKNYIVLHPAGKTMKKSNWSVSFYNDLIKKINLKYNMPIMVIGIPHELNDIKTIINQNEMVKFLFQEKIDLTSELIRNAKFFIGNDSGPFHIAESWQIPSVGLYKNNDDNYKRWHPLNKDKSLSIFISELENQDAVFTKIFNFTSQ